MLPSARHPHVLVPTDRVQASSAFRKGRKPTSRKQAAAVRVLSTGFRLGAANAWPHRLVLERDSSGGPGNVEDYLGSVFGQSVRVAVLLGPPRANRKPVLLVLDRAGDVLGVAKVGTSYLTNRLVEAESASLVALGRVDLSHVEAPRCLHQGQWNDLQILVQSPLPAWRTSLNHDPALRRTAMREVAECFGTSRSSLRDSACVARLADKVSALPQERSRELGGRVLEQIDADTGPEPVRFGTWHGDWTAWNMAAANGRVLLWDWERLERDVPVGYDELHYQFRVYKQRARSGDRPGVELLDDGPALLRPFGVPPAQGPAVTILYLLEMGTRYLLDRGETSVATAPVEQWLVPALEGFLTQSRARTR